MFPWRQLAFGTLKIYDLTHHSPFRLGLNSSKYVALSILRCRQQTVTTTTPTLSWMWFLSKSLENLRQLLIILFHNISTNLYSSIICSDVDVIGHSWYTRYANNSRSFLCERYDQGSCKQNLMKLFHTGWFDDTSSPMGTSREFQRSLLLMRKHFLCWYRSGCKLNESEEVERGSNQIYA